MLSSQGKKRTFKPLSSLFSAFSNLKERENSKCYRKNGLDSLLKEVRVFKAQPKSRDIPPKRWFSLGFEGHTGLFRPHPFMCKTPTPNPKVCAPFSCLINMMAKLRGRELNTNRFFSNFSGAPGKSRQNLRISHRKVWFPWVSQAIPSFFGPHPFTCTTLPMTSFEAKWLEVNFPSRGKS